MPYVIAKKNSEFLDTPVFHAGPDDKEAVAVFSELERAKQYIEDAGWSATHETGELLPLQLVRWVEAVRDQGADMLAIDPTRAAQESGELQDVIFLGDEQEAVSNLASEMERRSKPNS